ncbi:MAG: hypothetical protein M3H12_19540 [Chromatiales bacterium]|uniref:urea transporter n=1 Tax=endosymbiont of Lamellibrachia barhami TaxID=205975 RepID=UPI0015ADFB3F|nr:urea transporter [endosymbiont of Lamellibrachia barhami]MBA1443721.1 urea transporter [Gammaproteobacteria bacterium]
MKKIFAIIGLALLTSAAWAHDEHFGGNPDMSSSPIMDHGTGERAHALQKGEGDLYASQMISQPADHSHKSGPVDRSAYDPDGNQGIISN